MPENSTPNNSVRLIDPAALETIRSLQSPKSNDLLIKILTIFIEETPKQLDCINKAVTQGNTESIFQTLHSMKSSCASIGATLLSKTCATLEKQARENKLDLIVAEVPKLNAMTKQVINEVENYWLKNMR